MKNYFKTIRHIPKFLGSGTIEQIEDIAAERFSVMTPQDDTDLHQVAKGYLGKPSNGNISDYEKGKGLRPSPNLESGIYNGGLSGKGAYVMSKVSDAARGAVTAVSDSLLEGKNFDSLSQAIDQAANTAADFASLFGTAGKVASLAITGLNEITKLFGRTVQGFDVKIDNSGYSQSMMSQESKANRMWVGRGELNRQLQRRNEKLLMALTAQDISEDIKFEQTARANSIDNVLRNNQIALSGGYATSTLAAKCGGKLERVLKHKSVIKAENGAKLVKIDVSEEENIIPAGELHKNKHHIDLEGITQKGIPVVTIDTDADTFMEIKDQEDSLVIHAEIEKEEVIFTKELTDFVEEKLKEWNESDDQKILEEVGKRITKELLFNTNDRAELIDTLR